MAVNVATLTAKLVADTGQFKQGLMGASQDVQQFQKKTSGAFGMVKQGALGLAAGFGAVQVLSFAKGAIDQYSRLNESINAVEVSYGEAAEGVKALGRNSAREFGIAQADLNQAAVSLSAFVTSIDAADPAGAFKNVLGRATDFASVMNIDVGEALEKFRSGLAGESEPLRQFGIDVSEARVKQVLLRDGIWDGTGALTESQKVMGRYRAIMEQTDKTAGDFANTSDGIANRQRILSAEWANAQATLGKALAPAMFTILDVLGDLAPAFETVAVVVADVVAELNPLFTILGRVATVVGDLVSTTDSYTDAAGEAKEESKDWFDHFFDIINPMSVISGELLPKTADATLDMAAAAAEAFAEQRLINDEIRLTADALDTTIPIVDTYSDDALAAMSKAAEDAHEEHAELKKQVDAAREAVRKLIDPVYAAERAFDDYTATLEEARDDGKVTGDELADLVLKFGDLKFAESQLTPENIQAVRDAGRELAKEIGGGQGAVDDLIGSFGVLDAVTLEGLRSTLNEELTFDKPIQVAVRLTPPSDYELRRRMEEVLAKMRRDGVLAF
jgi:hypothetical protein